MRHTIIILACLAFIAYAIIRRFKLRFEHLNGWQKLFGLIAVLLAVLILLNPDLFALGLLGDTTFFDVLVMALSLQMLSFVQLAWRYISAGFLKGMRSVRIPSPGLRYLLAASAMVVASAASTIQKVVHRIGS